MRFVVSGLLLAFLLCASACAHQPVRVADAPPAREPVPLWITLDSDYAAAWDETLAAVTAVYGRPEADRKAGAIRTSWVERPSEWLVDGSGAPARVRSQLTVNVTGGGSRSTIRLVGSEQVLRDGVWSPVPSARTKEIELAERIMRRGHLVPSPDAQHGEYGDCRRRTRHCHNANCFESGG